MFCHFVHCVLNLQDDVGGEDVEELVAIEMVGNP